MSRYSGTLEGAGGTAAGLLGRGAGTTAARSGRADAAAGGALIESRRSSAIRSMGSLSSCVRWARSRQGQCGRRRIPDLGVPAKFVAIVFRQVHALERRGPEVLAAIDARRLHAARGDETRGTFGLDSREVEMVLVHLHVHRVAAQAAGPP